MNHPETRKGFLLCSLGGLALFVLSTWAFSKEHFEVLKSPLISLPMCLLPFIALILMLWGAAKVVKYPWDPWKRDDQ